MGHKIILCVNERGILLAFLCSGGRGSASGGRGSRGSRRSSEKRVNTRPIWKPAGPRAHYRLGARNRLFGQTSGGLWGCVWIMGLVLVLAE